MSFYLVSRSSRAKRLSSLWNLAPYCAHTRARNRYLTALSRTTGPSEQSNFLETFIETHRPCQTSLDYFSSTEWTRKILEDRAYEVIPFFPRYFNENTSENRFFSRTVCTESTIPHLISLRRKDLRPARAVVHSESPASTDLTSENAALPDILCLMSMGRDLEEHPSIVHGGFQCVLFDEIMRMSILLHYNKVCGPGLRDKHYTVKMNTDFFSPLTTPSDILLRSWLVKREGRKWAVKSDIVDSYGKLLTKAESLWITGKKERPCSALSS
jgi:acyl-coenzyme A thioesterase PaaI-like protein